MRSPRLRDADGVEYDPETGERIGEVILLRYQPDGWYYASVPGIKGLMSFGPTAEETLRKLGVGIKLMAWAGTVQVPAPLKVSDPDDGLPTADDVRGILRPDVLHQPISERLARMLEDDDASD